MFPTLEALRGSPCFPGAHRLLGGVKQCTQGTPGPEWDAVELRGEALTIGPQDA